MPTYSISFSIPAELVLTDAPQKKQLFSTIIPGSDYSFDDEDSYYHEYRKSAFAMTCRKSGWDCLRHYEILANGCVPYFQDAENVPPGTMADFPWECIWEGRRLAEQKAFDTPEYVLLVRHLLHHTRKYLTTVARAREILRLTENYSASSVLFLSGDGSPDYLRCLTLHGFKAIFGAMCVDFHRIGHLYATQSRADVAGLYGRGFTYTRRVPSAYDVECDRQSLETKIRKHEFDLVVFGSIHRGMPYWELVKDCYPPRNIILLCGEDIHACEHLELGKSFNLFVREFGTAKAGHK